MSIVPIYIVKIIKLDGTIVSDPLPTIEVSFDEVLSFPSERRLGSFSASLIPPRGANAHYIHIYKQLDYMQRVEIYESETVGTPVFTGHITEMSADLGSWEIKGDEWLGKLEQRRTGHYQPYPFSGLLVDMIPWVLNTWEYLVFDDFTAGLGLWTTVFGNWVIINEQLVNTALSSGIATIDTPMSLSTSQNNEFKARIEFVAGLQSNDWTIRFVIFSGGTNPWFLTISHVNGEDKTNYLLTQGGITQFFRDAGPYESPFDVVSSIEFYVYAQSTNQVCEIWLNGRQFMLSVSTNVGQGGNFRIRVSQVDTYFDNFIIFYRVPKLLQGTIDTSPTQTLPVGDYEPPQDTYLEVLEFLTDQLNFEWRTNPKPGLNNDTFDSAVNVGTDLSNLVKFEEGINLTNLSLSSSGSKLTTWYRFAGQGNDVNMALAEIYDKSAIDLYGIIENQLSNSRISTVNLARQVASNQLVRVKDGEGSVTASAILNTLLPQIRVGDTVHVKTISPDLDQNLKIVSIGHKSGTNEKQISFKNFPRSKSQRIGILDNDVGLINRGKSSQAVHVILNFKPSSRFIDETDTRFVFKDSGAEVPWKWTYFINGAPPPEPTFTPWNGTLAFGSEAGITANISLATTALRLVYYMRNNTRDCQVQIDGVNKNIIDQYKGSTPYLFAQNSAVDFTNVENGLHLFTFRKASSIDSETGKFITISGLILDSHLWHDIFLEGRAINSAYLTFTLSDLVSNNRPGILVYINGIDRTISLGGPSTGFLTNQVRLDVSQYISAPGLHTIDFRFNDPVSDTISTVDQLIEAVLDVKLFV